MIFLVQFEIEDGHVFFYMSCRGGFRNHHAAFLMAPAQTDLPGSFTVFSRDFLNGLVFKHQSARQGTVGGQHDAMFLAEIQKFPLVKERMEFHLVDENRFLGGRMASLRCRIVKLLTPMPLMTPIALSPSSAAQVSPIGTFGLGK